MGDVINSTATNAHTPNGFQKNHLTNNCKTNSTRKLVIKNFQKPSLPENYLETTWIKLEEAVIAIQTSKPISTSLEELYNAVQNVCSYKMARYFCFLLPF